MTKKLIILLLLSVSVFAQNPMPMPESYRIDSLADIRYKVGGIGLGFSTMRDNLLTPLRYKGFSLGGPSTKYTFRSNGRIDQRSTFSQTYLDSSGTKNSNLIVGVQYNMQNFKWKPAKKGAKNLYHGLMNDLLLGFRTATSNVNNVLSYEVGFGMGYGVLYKKSKGFGKNRVDFSAQLSSVLLGIYVRPGYSWSIPVQDKENEKVYLNFLFGTPLNYRNADFRFSTDFYFPDFNFGLFPLKFNVSKMIAYRVSYFWQYRDFDGASRYQRGVSGLQFGTIVRLN